MVRRAPHPAARVVTAPLRLVGHGLALPLRAIARSRPPAVIDPAALRPGDRPPTDGRLLLLFDGACGICLHIRDLLVLLDRRGRFAVDRIDRHVGGLLAEVDPAAVYETWHVVHADGRVEHGGAALTTVVGALPGGRPFAAAMRRAAGPVDAAYAWFARNRSWISQGTGLIHHPQRDPGAPH
ncbi:MAG: DCC1-like thiol-disulfide oxidoreductase family protein [Solirubrobacteraceae bacterium]|nr:DCC1-like thiol-disulfide oxidoreductase family protein [Patulibacter sp.]